MASSTHPLNDWLEEPDFICEQEVTEFLDHMPFRTTRLGAALYADAVGIPPGPQREELIVQAELRGLSAAFILSKIHQDFPTIIPFALGAIDLALQNAEDQSLRDERLDLLREIHSAQPRTPETDDIGKWIIQDLGRYLELRPILQLGEDSMRSRLINMLRDSDTCPQSVRSPAGLARVNWHWLHDHFTSEADGG